MQGNNSNNRQPLSLFLRYLLKLWNCQNVTQIKTWEPSIGHTNKYTQYNSTSLHRKQIQSLCFGSSCYFEFDSVKIIITGGDNDTNHSLNHDTEFCDLKTNKQLCSEIK